MRPFIACCALSLACSQRHAWPELPKDAAGVDGLVTRMTKRPVPASMRDVSPLDAAADAGWTSLPAGEAQVLAWLQRWLDGAGAHPAYLLFGTFHDSAAQVDTFRRWVGPGGLRGLTLVALEQLTSDGAWPGQAGPGHSALLLRFEQTGDREALAELARLQPEHDYTGWKYGSTNTVLELLAQSRGLGLAVTGCDQPRALQLAANERLRELHCALTLAATGKARRVAALYGQAHVRADGLPRFLEADARVMSVRLVGARNTPEPSPLLVLDGPVLVPLEGDEAFVLLPDAATAGKVDRVRIHEPGGHGVVKVSALQPGRFSIGKQSVELSEAEAKVTVEPGRYTWTFVSAKGVRVVGDLELVAEVELVVDADQRETRIVERLP